MTYKNSDVVDEALDQFFILIGLTIEGKLTLCPDFLARDFDFKLVCLRCLTQISPVTLNQAEGQQRRTLTSASVTCVKSI